MLSLKPGVRVQGLSTEIMLAVCIAESAFKDEGYDCVITSLLDGQHSFNSLHYSGNAVDLRIRHLQEAHAGLIAEDIETALGPDYDVVLESSHIHIEHQPRRP